MRAGSSAGRWLVGLVVGMQVGGWAVVARSEDRFQFGTKDVSVAGGYSISHNTGHFKDVETVDGVHVIPHFGYFVTAERGPRWARGNFELLVEPTLIQLTDGESATIGGLAGLGRWVFATGSVMRPYVEAGLGVVGGHVNLRQTNCDVNYIIEGGPGILFFLSEATALTVGYRFQHISNGSACAKNLGLNSSLFTFGISHFFP